MLVYAIAHLLAGWPNTTLWPALENALPRAALAALVSFVLTIALGPRWIAWLRRRFREPIKCASADVARLHASKQSTPTMGGLFLVAGLLLVALAVCDWGNPYVPCVVVTVGSLAALGAVDDWIKLVTDARGLRARTKFAWQCAIGLVTALLVYRAHLATGTSLDLALPLVDTRVSLGWMFVPWAALVIVAASNAVNLTDGLDGLAGGCLVCATGAMALVAYFAGHAAAARYLGIEHVAGADELVVIAMAVVGGLLGFLWFNCHPASVFMGDTGALALGGLLGALATIARQELVLVAIGGVFVVEAVSVIVQVAWFRVSRRRVLLCAPLHHHFQLRGWPEDKIVVRFWIAAALCAVTGVAGLAGPVHYSASGQKLPQLSIAEPAITAGDLPR